MTTTRLFAALFALFMLQGCETPKHYPISVEACAPQDPVHELSIENCAPTV